MCELVRGPRWRGAALGLALAALAGAAGAQIIPCVTSLQPGCRFTVNGKRGAFIKRVDDTRLGVLDAAVTTGEAMGLAGSSLNQGRFAATGLPMPQTEQALIALVAKIRAQWPHRDPGDIRVHIFGSSAYAPRAKPDKSIIVPAGLIERAQTDDEVAWVIAHELSHIALRHYARTPELIKREHASERLEKMIEVGLSLSQERVSHSNASFQFYQTSDPASARHADQAWSRSQQLREIFLLDDALASREQEDEADVDGFDLAWSAGYDAETGSTQALTVVEQDDKRAAAQAKSLSDKMQDALRTSANGNDAAQAAGGDVNGAATNIRNRIVLKMIFGGTEIILKTLSQNHRPAKIRIKGLAAYSQEAYPDTGAAPRDPTHTWLDAVRSTPEFTQAVAAINAREKAMLDIDAGDPAKARDDLAPALATRYAHAPLILNVQGAVFDGLGDFANADRSYEEADRAGLPPPPPPPSPKALPETLKITTARRGGGRHSYTTHHAPATPVAAPAPAPAQPPPPPPVDPYLAQSLIGYNDHILLLVRHQDFDRARAKIKEAEGRFGDHTRFLPAMINIAARTHDNAAMMHGLDECFATEDEALRAECRDAVYDDQQHKMIDSLAPEDRAKVDAQLDRSVGGSGRDDLLKQMAPPAVTAPAP